MLHLALYQPDIPQNTGAIIRLAACLGASVEIIEPCGFILDDTRIRRAHMDYIDHVKITRHRDLVTFGAAFTGMRKILLAPQGETSIYDFTFRSDDILILGPESKTTLPELMTYADAVLKIPMQPQARSLNVAMAGAIALGEARRQWPL
jgi:tRNA (cytidine/uridine-2'-O-)-methyltransferase